VFFSEKNVDKSNCIGHRTKNVGLHHYFLFLAILTMEGMAQKFVW